MCGSEHNSSRCKQCMHYVMMHHTDGLMLIMWAFISESCERIVYSDYNFTDISYQEDNKHYIIVIQVMACRLFHAWD